MTCPSITSYEWLSQYSNTGFLNCKPGVFFVVVCFLLYHRCSKNVTSQRSLIQLKVGGKAVINPGKIFYISREERFSNLSLCQQDLASEGFLFSTLLDAMSTASFISEWK